MNYQVQYSVGEIWEVTGGFDTKEAAQKCADKINAEWDGSENEPHDAEAIEDDEIKEYL